MFPFIDYHCTENIIKLIFGYVYKKFAINKKKNTTQNKRNICQKPKI